MIWIMCPPQRKILEVDKWDKQKLKDGKKS
jgi:hypothetical protein